MIPGGCTRVFTLTFPERERQKPTKPERRARYKKNNENTPPPPSNRLHPPILWRNAPMPNKATTSYKNQHHTIYTFNNKVHRTIKTFRMKSPGGPLQVPSCLGPGSSSLVFPGDVPSASNGYTGEQLNPDNGAPRNWCLKSMLISLRPHCCLLLFSLELIFKSSLRL